MPAPLAPSAAARRLAPRFGLDPVRLGPLDGFESEVLAAQGADGPAILKVMQPAHRTPDEVQAEIDWLLALRAAGVSVAQPLAVRDGGWLVTEGDPPLVGVAYVRAPGRHLPPDAWTPAFFRAHGALVGQLQAHTRSWSSMGPQRAGWLDNRALERAPEALPGDSDFLEAVAALLAMRQADLAIFVRLDVPEERWDDDLRAAAERLRDQTAARHEVVPPAVLHRFFGD